MFFHLLCVWFALVLPAYATYKTLARPSPDGLSTLAMYWAVLALFTAFDQSLGFVLSWLPFYWELKTLFLLYISLPQTQGSTYVYKTFLHPWCSRNEADIDSAVASAQANALAFCRARIAALVDLVSTLLSESHANAAQHSIDHLKRLWAAYGPSLFATPAPRDPSDAHLSSYQPHQSHAAN